MATYKFSREQINNLVRRRTNQLYIDDQVGAYEAWKKIDTYYKNEQIIKLPKNVLSEERANDDERERVTSRINFTKRVAKASVTMIMRGGVMVTDDDGEEVSSPFDEKIIERSILYTVLYGGCWFHHVNDRERPYRVYKPSVAVEIPDPDDNDVVRAVLAVETLDDYTELTKTQYKRYTWYEYATDNRTVRKLVIKRRSTTIPNFEEPDDMRELSYMPLFLVKNGGDEQVWRNSDVLDGIPLFDSYERNFALFDVGIEDEAFRQIFLANVDPKQITDYLEMGPRNVLAAKNPPEEAPPALYSVQPSDKRQMLQGLKDKIDLIAMLTRTSPLELANLPVTDIPTSTLLTLYGPQLERCMDTAEALGKAWSRIHHFWNLGRLEYQRDSLAKVKLTAQLPVNRQRELVNLVDMYDRYAMSGREMLRTMGYSDVEVEAIMRERVREIEEMGLNEQPGDEETPNQRSASQANQ